MKKIIVTLVFMFLALNSFSQQINPKLLQGKWQSLDDKTNFLVFTKNLRKETAAGMDGWYTGRYVISNKCINESDKKNVSKPETGRYLSALDDDLCWYIDELNSRNLTLIFIGRGNYLRYKRIRN
jgi:hypothetical protein